MRLSCDFDFVQSTLNDAGYYVQLNSEQRPDGILIQKRSESEIFQELKEYDELQEVEFCMKEVMDPKFAPSYKMNR